MKPTHVSRRWTFGIAALTASLGAFALASANPSAGTSSDVIPGQTTGLLPANKIILESTVEVNLTHHSATLPLHKGFFEGEKVWYVITEASDEGAARDLNVNFAPKLANVGIGCDVCVQDVTLVAPRGNKFGEAFAHFQGAPDFSPKRVLKAGPTIFPPSVAKPGGVGSPRYSPFIQFRGSKTVYNAPIVATGNGPFDVVSHSDTADRVLKVNPAKKAGPGAVLRTFGRAADHQRVRLGSADPLRQHRIVGRGDRDPRARDIRTAARQDAVHGR